MRLCSATLRCSFSLTKIKYYTVSGTLRSNLDPFNTHDDATLWDALRRAYLVEDVKPVAPSTDGDTPSGAHTPVNRFSLDTVIEDEGANLSVGQVRLAPSAPCRIC